MKQFIAQAALTMGATALVLWWVRSAYIALAQQAHTIAVGQQKYLYRNLANLGEAYRKTRCGR